MLLLPDHLQSSDSGMTQPTDATLFNRRVFHEERQQRTPALLLEITAMSGIPLWSNGPQISVLRRT